MRFVPSREPGSSMSPRRRRAPASARKIRSGATWAKVSRKRDRCPERPPRVTHLDIHLNDQEYAPVAGLWEVREAIASMYNNLFRRGMPSQYSAENVAVCGGGRVSIMRACAAIGQIHLGHFLPDYTAYEELLDIFRRFTPIPILLDPEHGYDFSLDSLRREISGEAWARCCSPTRATRPAKPSLVRSSSRGWPRRETSTARCSWTSSTRTTYGKTARRCSARPNSWRTSRRIRS